MGIFDSLSGKVKKKAQEKAVEAAKKQIVDGVKQRYEDAKEALFGDDDGAKADARPSAEPDAEAIERKRARDEKKRQKQEAERAREEEERLLAEAQKKLQALEAEKRRLEHEKMVRDFEAKKIRQKAEVEDELAALKKRFGKK